MANTIALIDSALYEKFATLRKQMVSDGIGDLAKVFVPVGAAAPARRIQSAPRVLFVGKATSGWNKKRLNSFDGSKKQAEVCLEEWLVSPNRSAFWQFSRAILREVLGSVGIDVDISEPASFAGWTNIVKIGSAASYSPPSGLALDRQKGLCIESLRAEIKRFRPTAVVLTTQDYAKHEIVFPLFGGDDGRWSFDTQEQDSVAWKFHPDLNMIVIWTNHPQGMRPPGTRSRVQSRVAHLVVKAAREHSLPRSA